MGVFRNVFCCFVFFSKQCPNVSLVTAPACSYGVYFLLISLHIYELLFYGRASVGMKEAVIYDHLSTVYYPRLHNFPREKFVNEEIDLRLCPIDTNNFRRSLSGHITSVSWNCIIY